MSLSFDSRSLLLALLLAAVAGCGDSDVRADGPAAAAGPTPGYATGKITMPDGKPITVPGAVLTISISGVGVASENLGYTPVIKPDGTYKQKLAGGSFRFGSSTIKLTYEGQPYTLWLEPVGPNWNRNQEAEDGIVQDFVWKPTGLHLDGKPDPNNHTQWYGGTVGVRFGTWRQDIGKAPGNVPDGAKCVFTLKPTVEKTVDGQPAKTLTIERKFSERWKTCDSLNDLPIAHYDLTGEVHMPDGTKKPMLWHVTYAKYLPVMPVRMEPDDVMRGVSAPRAEWLIE